MEAAMSRSYHRRNARSDAVNEMIELQQREGISHPVSEEGMEDQETDPVQVEAKGKKDRSQETPQ